VIENLPSMAGGGALSAVIMAAIAWFTRKSWHAAQRQDVAAADAGTDIIEMMRAEVGRLSAKVEFLEARGDRQDRRIWQLETDVAMERRYSALLKDVLAQHGIDAPPMPALMS
jgi:hypothetical protein